MIAKYVRLFALLALIPQTASEVPDVRIERCDVVRHELDPAISALIRNDTRDTILMFEVRVCYTNKTCAKDYLGGRFLPHVASWSDDLHLASRRIESVTLVRVQTVEERLRGGAWN